MVAAVTGPSELGTDFAGFGGADGVVAGEGLLPVVPGLDRVAVGVVGAGEAAVRAGLLQWRADLGGEPESGGVVFACLAGVTCLEENVPEAVERVGLRLRIAVLAGHGQCLLEVAGRLLVVAEPQVSLAEPDHDLGFAERATEFLEQGQGLLEVSGRVLAAP